MRTFPQPDILVIVDAPIPELVEEASNKLAQALVTRRALIRGIHQLDNGPFFEQNGLLFLPTEEVARITAGLAQAKPLLQRSAPIPASGKPRRAVLWADQRARRDAQA
jgi:hypothetical protein